MILESPRIIEYDHESHQRNFRYFVNHQQSSQRNFWEVWESLKIPKKCPKEISVWFVNWWESPRITPKKFLSWILMTDNHQDSLQKNFWVVCELLKITKKYPKKSESFINHQDHWESPKRYYRVVCESPRITKNWQKKFQYGLWITKNHPKQNAEVLTNYRESLQRNFRVQHKAQKITPNKIHSGLWILE